MSYDINTVTLEEIIGTFRHNFVKALFHRPLQSLIDQACKVTL